MKHARKSLYVIFFALIGSISATVATLGGITDSAGAQEPFQDESGPSAVSQAVPGSFRNSAMDIAIGMNNAFVSLVERAKPGVVRIEVRQEGQVRTRTAPGFRFPDPFRPFFDFPQFEEGRDPPPQIGGGTGFLISEDGYIVTNHHVVGEADEITVWLENRHSYPAELIGTDPTTDVAVIRIEGNDLPALSWGSSDALRVGEWVVAIGNPGVGNGRPLDYTVTSGIVSAKNRPLQLIGNPGNGSRPGIEPNWSDYAIENFIQTDAVINPGNSGGPLLNLYGEVVGINTAIASTSGYYQGYGFAVPGDLARRVAEDLIEDGTVERAWLGVRVTGVTPIDAELYGLPRVAGALVQEVTDASPAAAAGLEFEDVIVGLDGKSVELGGGLQQLVAEHRPGEEVTLQVFRDGRAREVQVELGEAPIRGIENRLASPARRSSAADRLGIEVAELSTSSAGEFGFNADVSGVVVTSVDPAGPGGRRGIPRGWRIAEVNDTPINSARVFEQALGDVEEGDIVSLLLESPDGEGRVVNLRAR